MAFTSALNPRVVKTGLDEVFYPEFDAKGMPVIADAEDTVVFRQRASDKGSEQIMELKGSGAWSELGETQSVPDSGPITLYYQEIANKTLSNGVLIPQNLIDDQQVDVYSDLIRDFAINGKASKDSEAFKLYREGFTTVGADGQYIFDTDHPITGGTMSNRLSVALDEANLNTAMVALLEQKSRDGVIKGSAGHCLLVPSANLKNALEITGSELRSGTADNDINVWYSTRFGIIVKSSPYLGTAAGGDDTSWYLLSKVHGMLRYNRLGIQTEMVDHTKRDDYVNLYKARYRQGVGVAHPFGIIASKV